MKVLEELRSETFQRDAREEAIEAVTKFCANVDPQDVLAEIVPRNGNLDGPSLSIEEFLTDLLPVGQAPEPFATSSWSDRAQTRELHYVDQSLCWLPPALQTKEVPTGGSTLQTVATSTTDSGSFVVKSIRVDLSKTAVVGDFATFAPAAAVRAKPMAKDDKIY